MINISGLSFSGFSLSLSVILTLSLFHLGLSLSLSLIPSHALLQCREGEIKETLPTSFALSMGRPSQPFKFYEVLTSTLQHRPG